MTKGSARKQPPAPVAWDGRASLRAAGGDPAFLNELMELFLKDAGRAVVRFGRLARAGRWPDLAKEAHRLKGAALTLRLGGLAETLAGLEKAAQGGRESAAASRAEQAAAELEALRRFWSGRKRG